MKPIYLAEMPDCFGYGLQVLATSESKALALLEREYNRMRKGYQFDMRFEEALEYFDGGVRPIELNKVYNDGFRE